MPDTRSEVAESYKTLSHRAWLLMPPQDGCDAEEFRSIRNHPRKVYFFEPQSDLNDAAALWEAAPGEVKDVVHVGLIIGGDRDQVCDATIALFTNPAALTKAIVEAWEAFNAK